MSLNKAIVLRYASCRYASCYVSVLLHSAPSSLFLLGAGVNIWDAEANKVTPCLT